MEYYVENKFKTDDEELIKKEALKIAEEIIKNTCREHQNI